MSLLVARARPLTRKCPPPPPVSQRSYWVIGSPSGSLAVNKDNAAKTCPGLAVMFELLSVTTGGISTLCAVTMKLGDHALHCLPSLTRTHRVSTFPTRRSSDLASCEAVT